MAAPKQNSDSAPLLSGDGASLKLPNSPANGSSSHQKDDPMILPPGTTSSQFSSFITKAQAIVSAPNIEIIKPDNELKDGDYMHPCHGHDMHAILDRNYFVASCIISPRSVPEVQSLMRLCNEFEIPVWPYSIGRNTGYGGAAPRVPGSVGLNLGRHMNQVLKVDTEDAWALVEPGVTFLGLHDYLEERGLREKVWLDVSLPFDLCGYSGVLMMRIGP
jgi:hypothetical protein